MKRKCFTEEQIIGVLKQAEARSQDREPLPPSMNAAQNGAILEYSCAIHMQTDA